MSPQTSNKPQTIVDRIRAYRQGDTLPSVVLAAYLETTRSREPEVHAYIDIFEDVASQAERADDLVKEGRFEGMPLLGIPLATKSNILIKGKRATACSKMLENYIAPYDATVIERLRKAGAIFVGSTNMDEFAMGSSTEKSYFGPTHNPHDLARVPGGTSGGSAAAVAMESVPGAIGTDTGGSVRQPASFCGIVGLKPTYGAVSRYGVIAMGSSLDQVGPLAHTVADAEILYDVIRGVDPYDSTTYPDGVYPVVDTKDTYHIGVPRDFLRKGIDPDVLARFEASLEALAKAGHTIVDISLPYMEKGLAAYYITVFAEISSNLARYDGMRYGLHVPGKDLLCDYLETRREGFGKEVRRRILLGAYVLSSGYYDAYYRKAEIVRTLMREELAAAYRDVDIIVTPTVPTPAYKIGEKEDPLSMYLGDIYTVPVNLTGVPALSVPMGTVDRDGKSLPVGIQFIGPHAGEARLFDIGKRFQGEQ
ncbi:Asp-tRNA(Asn)/Glu-tRNA(Gln) amidotransferase subunit GatA [Candidatus Kaiserbacteria bacterium]|nr:Asp-tRNA(Asn)/Glu-tRNA(Gln) amidotransferase subunit GatA [Candidatus Kaiserbacteria bacterium]